MSAPDNPHNSSAQRPNEATPLISHGPTTGDPEDLDAVPGSISNGNISDSTRKTDDSQRADAHQRVSFVRGALCTVSLGCLIFLQATNISLVTTTQSAIASDLDAFEKTTWFTSSYLIALSALGPLNGKLSSVFSPQSCLLVSAIVLALGCVLSGLAHNFETFVAGRTVTGVGASGIFTISLIIVLELAGSKRRGIAIGLLNSGYTIGVAVGATAAGALLPSIGWRALFWIQAPISLFGGVALFLTIPYNITAGREDKSGYSYLNRLRRLDYFGAVTLTASIVLLLYALSSSHRIPLLPILLSAIVLVTFLLNEIYIAQDPIVPISLLKSRGLLLTCLGTMGYMMARWSVLFYAPTYAIAVRQWSPATAGSILIPTNGGFAAGGLLVGWLHIRRHGSFYVPSLVVYALYPFTLVALAFLSTQRSSSGLYILMVFLCGAVTGAALNYTFAHLLHLTPKDTHYIATSLIATVRGFAGSFGSAIGGGLFTRTLSTSLSQNFAEHGMHTKEKLLRQLLGSPALVGKLSGVEKEVAIQGYEDALRTLFLAGAGLAFLMVFAQAGTGFGDLKEEGMREDEWSVSTEERSRGEEA